MEEYGEWVPFGSHVDQPGSLEFSAVTDDGGFPLYERRVYWRRVFRVVWDDERQPQMDGSVPVIGTGELLSPQRALDIMQQTRPKKKNLRIQTRRVTAWEDMDAGL